jgi:FeS assembly SUF system protein
VANLYQPPGFSPAADKECVLRNDVIYMETDDYKLPGSVASLPVLPSGGKVDQLRRELAEEHRTEVPKSVETKPTSIERKLLEGKIIAAISKVYDPEIPVNVYELGLIYGIDIADDNSVVVRMTLTAPGCPVAGSLPGEVEKQVESVDEVKEAEVSLVWEPAWDKSRMSEAAVLQLGF